MKVFIAGATGVLGRRIVRQLAEQGHEPIGMARSARGAETIRALGGEPREVDLFDVDGLARAADGAEVVVHAATAIPTGLKVPAEAWAENDRIRREGTRALAEAAGKVGARLYLQQSIVWVARPEDGSFFDEDSPLHSDWVTQSAVDGEEIAREIGERHGLDVGVLRFGGFYAAEAAHTRMLADGLKRRTMPIVGRGDAAQAMIHAEDAAAAVVAAAARRGGLWHVVDDEPVAVGELLRELARRIGAPAPRRVPAWLARLLAGEHLVRHLTIPMRTSNERFKREVGWRPRFSTVREGLDEVVAAWRAEGLLGRAAA